MPAHSIALGELTLRTWTLVGQLPVLALFVWLFLAGRARGWAWRPALLATAALAAGMPLGVTVLPSVLGALGGGIATWLLAQRCLGLRRPPVAALAIGLAAVVAIGRWGCFLNDCCFGRVTVLPWAAHYGPGSATWILHQALGWIGPDAPSALPVHPYPLYESAGLLVWLPVALWLRRRLRSEAALLFFTAAFDLALRGFIDGTRAMVNVWWAMLDSAWGQSLFQWALFAAALACLAAGLVFERRARCVAEPAPACAGEPAPARLWAVFAGLWAIGWLGEAGQTLFLHRALVAALAVSALALRLPSWLPARRWLRAVAAPALACALVLVLGTHVERSAEASAGAGQASASSRGWLYEVDHQRGVLVRVGSAQESPASVDQRRTMLDLPSADSTGTPPPSAAPSAAVPAVAKGRTWVGGGFLGGAAEYRVQSSCSDDYVAYDRKLGGGWLQAEHETPATPTSVWWLGGRAVALFESQKTTTHNSSAGDSIDEYSIQGYQGQVWGEWEHPNVTLGAGVLLGLQNKSRTGGTPMGDGSGSASSLTGVARPSFRLRAGFSFLGLDAGAYDRASFAGSSSAHVGVSGAIGRGFVRMRHPDDAAVKYFVGGVLLPGADKNLSLLLFGVGLEAFVSRQLVLGVEGGFGEGGFLTGYVRTALGR
jgi:hypothetical protein